MRLSSQTDYALRVLMLLATRNDTLVTIGEIATRYKISKNHLMKIAHTLSLLGLVDSTRGRTGGLKLAKPAVEISVGHVVRVLENDSALVECFRKDGGKCLITPACRLRGAIAAAAEAFHKTLDTHSIADLVDGNERFLEIFAGEVA